MVSAVGRFSAVVIIGVALSATSFYFAFTNFSNRTTQVEEKKDDVATTVTYSDDRIEFQYPNTLTVSTRTSPVDNRVFLIDVQPTDQKNTDPIPLRIQIMPKQTKVACDSLGGTAGSPLPLGMSNVQPCFIPRMFNNTGTGMRMEIPRDTFTALFLVDRYDVSGSVVNAILASVKWR